MSISKASGLTATRSGNILEPFNTMRKTLQVVECVQPTPCKQRTMY